MKVLVASLAAVAVSSAVVGCSGGDDGPQELDFIDGPAVVDPEFREQGDTDSRSDAGG